MVNQQDELSVWRYNSFYTKELEPLKWLESVANYKTSPNLIDVGSSIGLYSLCLISLSNNAKIVSIEPFEKNSTLQKLNLSLNSFLPRVELITNPVANHEGLVHAEVNDLRPGGSGYKLIEISKESNGSKLIVIKTLDLILKNKDETFGLKIDVDGKDFKVLHGASISLKNGLLDTILIEASELIHEKIELYLKIFKLVPDPRFNDLVLHSIKGQSCKIDMKRIEFIPRRLYYREKFDQIISQ